MSRNFDDRSRKLARERFWETNDKRSYTCPDCGRGREEIVGEFQVHHKSGNPHDNRLDQLVALCGFCHRLREDKKPSLERIKEFRKQAGGDGGTASNSKDADAVDVPRPMKLFLNHRACLCTEGRGYGWFEPFSLWADVFEEWYEELTGRRAVDFETDLLRTLRASPETTVRWEDEGVLSVIGPDPHGKKNCDCLTKEDLSWVNAAGGVKDDE